MGSLTSRPKVLPVQQPEIITLAPPVTTTPTTTTTTTQTSGGTDTTTDDGTDTPTDTGATARGESLLDRSRGILSTVLTGFNGVLSQTTSPQRKSLLGE